MLDLDTTFLQALNSNGIDDLFLLAVLEGEGLPTQKLALSTRSLTWGSTQGYYVPVGGGQSELVSGDRAEYAATDGAFSTRRDTLDSEPPGSSISFTNLDGSWYDEMHWNARDYNGAKITFLTVFASVDPTGHLLSQKSRITDGPWMLSGGTLGDDGVTFKFGAAFNALKLKVPALMSRARRCQFLYKGEFCKSTSTLPTCDKTTSACAQRFENGILRFSAWPFSNRKFF